MKTLITNLFRDNKINLNKPIKSYRWDVMSLYYKGVFYFPSDLQKHESDTYFADKQYKIQGVFNDGKWRQDTFYITTEFRDFLLEAL